MARTGGNGIPYFSHDTNMSGHDGIEILEALYGLDGYAIWTKLLERIYGQEGYFIAWNQKAAAVFAKKNQIDIQRLDGIISTCISEGLFSERLHKDHSILTSKRIQKHFLFVTKRRSSAAINPLYSLAESEEHPLDSSRNELVNEKELHTIDDELHAIKSIASNKPLIADNSGEIASNSTQSIVKNSKVKESGERAQDFPEEGFKPDPPTIDEVITFFKTQMIANPADEGSAFWHHFDSLDWEKNGTPIKRWKSLATNWINRARTYSAQKNKPPQIAPPARAPVPTSTYSPPKGKPATEEEMEKIFSKKTS